ncbi:MAG: signal peptidase II [Phycisphaerae bacterium]|nr:signal peptidase II [Phycisphaerae bacterium]
MPNSKKQANPPASSPPAALHQRALRSPLAVIVFAAVVLVSLAGDLLTKHYVFQTLLDDPQLPWRIEQIRHAAPKTTGRPDVREMLHMLDLHRQICPGVKFTLSANPGAVFGTVMHESQTVHRLIVGLATAATTVLVLYFFGTSGRRAWGLHVSMAFILAGALGNLYDRLFSSISLPVVAPIRHNVRDFIDCSEIGYPWVFNVADMLLVVGVGVLALRWIISGRKQKAGS